MLMMDRFQCYMYNLTSEDQNKVKVHLKLAHNMKVEDEDIMLEKLMCALCPYSARNMDHLRDHMINEHNKDRWNWGLEMKAAYYCDECDFEFPERAMLRKHIESGHTEVNQIIVVETTNIQDPIQEKCDP